MKITLKSTYDDEYGQQDVLTVDGVESYFGAGEPEDRFIGRDGVSGANIIAYMRQAYEAGKNGMPFEVEKLN